VFDFTLWQFQLYPYELYELFHFVRVGCLDVSCVVRTEERC
jgi:hypothetical protein